MLVSAEGPTGSTDKSTLNGKRRRNDRDRKVPARSVRGIFRFAVLLVCFGVLIAFASAQNTPAQDNIQKPAETSQQKIERVTTTVVVHGEVKDNYLSDTTSAGSLDGTPIKETPISVSTVSSALMTDQVSRVLSDVVKNDASVGEDYAPVGYYGDFQIRGFPLDLATGLEINGLTIAGEQDVPLENKERVEIVKGIAGVESGVASAGGLIDYVTKRPAVVEAVDLATDHRGSAFGAVDFGRLFGSNKQVGARVNLAGERIATYVNDADGWRAVGAGSADWKISPKAIVNGNFEYQHKVQRSVSGYQLLGGTIVPDLDRISPSTMLGEQSWSKPNTFDVYNTGARFDYDLPKAWHAFAAAGFSHSLIDDNVVYAYGCYYEDACNVSGGPDPWFFAPDGTYDIYDYRNPGELRIDAQAQMIATGHLRTGAIDHELTGGAEFFRRSVQMPGAPPDGAPDTVQFGAVFAYVGSENIYEPNLAFPIEDPVQSAGPRALYEDDHQAGLVVQDRLRLPGRIQLLAAGRYNSLHDHNYSAQAADPEAAAVYTDKLEWLPQFGATFSPTDHLVLYGNYGVLLSLGPQAPFWTANGSQFLEPFKTRQSEIGAKYEAGQRLLLTGALFHMRAPFFYPKAITEPDSFCPAGNLGDLCFESEGHETHNGVEMNAQGKVANWVQLNASAMAISAKSSETGTPDFDNKQVINVPRWRTALFADLLVPHARGLHLMPGWSYTSSKEATRDDLVSVPGYNLFNLGARYTPGGEHGRMTLRLYADNILDKRYWKDTGASLGDTFVHLGAPTTVRLSAHYTF
jgi:iron complex outermembrane recepter protein